MSEFEEYIKARYPVDYESLKEKYPNVPVCEFYGDEQDLWDLKQSEIDQLKSKLALCREENKGLVGKVSVEKKRVEVALQVIFDCRAIGADRIYTCDAVEKCLRGEHENN